MDHFLKFAASVVGTASVAALVLGSVVKVLHVIQTKATMGAAMKSMMAKKFF